MIVNAIQIRIRHNDKNVVYYSKGQTIDITSFPKKLADKLIRVGKIVEGEGKKIPQAVNKKMPTTNKSVKKAVKKKVN